MKHESLTEIVADPNPMEPAECSLTLLSRPWQNVDGDALLGEIVMLYDRKARFSLICKILDEIEKHDQSLVYVGTREKCEKWAEIFTGMDLVAEVEPI